MQDKHNNELHGSKILPPQIRPMSDLMNKVKKASVEPKVFGVMVRSGSHINLYVGVHLSLEDAFAEAKRRFLLEIPPMGNRGVDLELFVAMPGAEALKQLLESGSAAPLVSPALAPIGVHIKQVKEAKNALMRRMIDSKDLEALGSAKGLLNKREIKFIESKITPEKAAN